MEPAAINRQLMSVTERGRACVVCCGAFLFIGSVVSTIMNRTNRIESFWRVFGFELS